MSGVHLGFHAFTYTNRFEGQEHSFALESVDRSTGRYSPHYERISGLGHGTYHFKYLGKNYNTGEYVFIYALTKGAEGVLLDDEFGVSPLLKTGWGTEYEHICMSSVCLKVECFRHLRHPNMQRLVEMAVFRIEGRDVAKLLLVFSAPPLRLLDPWLSTREAWTTTCGWQPNCHLHPGRLKRCASSC